MDIVVVETVMNDDDESKVLESEKKNGKTRKKKKKYSKMIIIPFSTISYFKAVTQESSTMNTDGINDVVNQQENKSPPPYTGKSTESSLAPVMIPTDSKSHALKHSMNGDVSGMHHIYAVY